MKILLIQPFGDESNTNYPPLGLLYLASYSRKNSSHVPKILDLRVDRSGIDGHLDEILQFDPDVIGLTGMSIEWSAIRKVSAFLKERLDPKVVFVSGGPHSTIFSNRVLQ